MLQCDQLRRRHHSYLRQLAFATDADVARLRNGAELAGFDTTQLWCAYVSAGSSLPMARFHRAPSTQPWRLSSGFIRTRQTSRPVPVLTGSPREVHVAVGEHGVMIADADPPAEAPTTTSRFGPSRSAHG